MEVSLPVWILSIKSVNSIVARKSLMKDQCATYCGVTQMNAVGGVFLQEALVIHLVRISLSNSTTQMVSH